MERSKLPIISRSKPSSSHTSSAMTQPKVLQPSMSRDDNSIHQPIRRGHIRRSKSLTDMSTLSRVRPHLNLEKITTKKPLLKALPEKPFPTASRLIKTAPKRPALTKPDVSSAPKVSKPAKIAPYDYKARYNLQVEKTSMLQTNLKEKESELFEIKTKYNDLTEEYNTLKHNFGITVNQLNQLEEEQALWISGKAQLEMHIKDLKKTVSTLETECNHLRPFKIEKENLETTNKNITKELENSKSEMSAKLKLIKDQEELINRFKNNVQELETVRRTMHNQIQDLKGTIRVYCRVRPQLPSESDKFICNLTYVDEDALEIRKMKESISSVSGKLTESTLEFVFDKVFRPDSTQLEIFEELSQLIQSAMDGYNVCVFAYGQTGSGKTYTMQGEERGEHKGMIPRSVDLIFKLIKKYQLIGWTYLVEASFLEIYNEKIRDLLASNAKECLEIRYNEGRGTSVTNLSVIPVNSATELHCWMQRANQNRAVAVTNYNEHSSRSHAVTKITLTGTNTEMRTIYTGSLSLVDLAGSESARTSERMTETKNINKSLSALGTVMMALQNKETHVPYRNSKLTYLLQSSLGGNSKTLMFVNIAPLEECHGESVNALRFASKVKEVKITSKKNKAYFKKEN